MTPATCLICGGDDHDTVFTYTAPDMYEKAVGVADDGYARAWVRCTRCGFHYSRFSRDPNQLDRIYDKDYRDTGQGYRKDTPEAVFERIISLPPDQSESVQRATDIQSTVTTLQAHGVLPEWRGTPFRLLDVGGASGVFAYVFQNTGASGTWQTEIVDPGEQGRFVEAHGVEYHAQRFDGSFTRSGFEVISMNYLLEHVADPRAVLAAAYDHLLPSGLLYVEVPDELAFGRMPPDDDIFNSCHLWMFGPKSLGTLLDDTGFEPVKLTRTKSPRGHYALAVMATRRNAAEDAA